jgi:hypothetical protein
MNTQNMDIKAEHAYFIQLAGHRSPGRRMDTLGDFLFWQLKSQCIEKGSTVMNCVKPILKLLLVVVSAMQLTACERNLKWEEEVLLNTGEIIWVTKEVRYTVKGQPGNPLDLGYLPDFVESTSFTYGGRSYSYKGDAGIFVLAISAQKLPVLIAGTGRGWGYRNNYPLCTKPNYVQLVPDGTGQQWAWPSQIEPWTYNLPANLMLNRDEPSHVKRRYTILDKSQQSYLKDPQLLNSQKVNPSAKHQDCHKE